MKNKTLTWSYIHMKKKSCMKNINIDLLTAFICSLGLDMQCIALPLLTLPSEFLNWKVSRNSEKGLEWKYDEENYKIKSNWKAIYK